MTGSWAKWLDWPTVIHNEEQEQIESIRRAVKECRRPPLPGGVDTSEAEIIEMAGVIDEHGHDAGRFLRLLHQDCEAYGIAPEEVYVIDDLHEGPHWPSGGFGLTLDELEWLTEVTCTVSHRATYSGEERFDYDPLDRFDEFCLFCSYALEIGIPPTIFRGDQ